jgi:hypothetical protein
MNIKILIVLIKIVSILLIVTIFSIIIYQYLLIENIEKFNQNSHVNDYNNQFKYKPYNIRLMYENTGEYPWNRHTINSSIPYDVNIKKEAVNVYYFEFDNATYNNKLKEVFKSNCEELIIAVEGSEWNNWQNPKTLTDNNEKNKLKAYYDNIYAFAIKKLNSSIMELPSEDKKKKIQIVHDIMLRYRKHKTNPSYYMFDIDMILYRAGKFQGKHVKFVAITDGININVILVRVIGVVSEDNIVIYPYTSYDKLNTIDFHQYIPLKYGMIESDTKSSSENTFNVSDNYMNREVENIMYKKLLEENIPEDIDISNNNFNPNPDELVIKNQCYL